MKFIFQVLSFLAPMLISVANAQVVKRPVQGTTATTEPFYLQIDQIEEISYFVDRVDLARLISIRASIQTIVDDLEANVRAKKQEVTFSSLRKIQNLIVQYRFSQVFFGWSTPRSSTSVYTEYTSGALQKLNQLQQEMVVKFGYDDSPYTQITAQSFKQIQKLMYQLEDLPIDSQFKADLRATWRDIGEVIAISEQGDRPLAFKKSIPMLEKLRKLYPQFDQVSATNIGFPIVMEIQGLVEFYAEYAQVEQGEGN